MTVMIVNNMYACSM